MLDRSPLCSAYSSSLCVFLALFCAPFGAPTPTPASELKTTAGT